MNMAQAIKRIEENQTSREAGPLGGAAATGLDLGPFRRALAIAASGLTVAEGQARIERESDRIRAAKRRARLERHRAMTLRDGEDMPALTPADLKALADADRKEASAVKGRKGAPAIRDAARRDRDQVAKARAARAEARAAELRLAETVRLDAVREDVAPDAVIAATRGQRDKRLRTRDGLVMLRESGALTPKDGRSPMDARIEADRLLSLGLRYRDRYEISAASLRSCLGSADNKPPSPNLYVQCRAAQRRAALANQVRVLDVAVVTQLGEEALLVLRMVAGEARTVNSITTSARRRERLTRLLPRALAIVGDIVTNAR